MILLLGACLEPQADTEVVDLADAVTEVDDLADAGAALVDQLSFRNYMQDIETLSGFGDRLDGSESYAAAAEWLENRLAEAGYVVEHHGYMQRLQYRQNIFVTKVGAVSPENMYIVSAHLDGLGGGGAADDDASGVALVLQAAEVFASPQIQTDATIRFIFWNTDLDIEYQNLSAFAEQSRALAETWQASNVTYSSDYPAEVGGEMSGTDSVAFQDHTAAISIRENTRWELVSGGNPNWHRSTDVYETYSEQDFRLGFNALQMFVGAVAELARASTKRDTY